MHVLLSVLLPFLVGVNWLASQQTARLTITRLTGDYYVYTTSREVNGTAFPSNSMYIVTDSGIVLIDTPWDTTQFQPLLDSLWERHHKRVVLCIATHFHDDRTAGLSYFQQRGISTYSSELTRALCREHHEHEAAHVFASDTLFVIGNHTLQTFFPGAGHSPDNIVVWCARERILYGGCIIKSCANTSLGNLSDANTLEWETSVRRLIRRYRTAKYVVPGHFGWDSKTSPRHTLTLLQEYNRTGGQPLR